MTENEAIVIVRVKGRERDRLEGLTREEGRSPFVDEVLVAAIENLRHVLRGINERARLASGRLEFVQSNSLTVEVVLGHLSVIILDSKESGE